MSEKKVKTDEVKKMTEIKPLKDFVIAQNEHFFELKKGEAIEVPSIFIPNLKTEKVIK